MLNFKIVGSSRAKIIIAQTQIILHALAFAYINLYSLLAHLEHKDKKEQKYSEAFVPQDSQMLVTIYTGVLHAMAGYDQGTEKDEEG
jgi:hypothetical protein